jgi:sulfide dehydrogenase cytochrome subunit
MKRQYLYLLIGVLCVPLAVFGADVETLTAICVDCHGAEGLSESSDVPILAGQAFTVIEDNLLAFRDGDRACTETSYRHGDTNRPATSMCEIAGALSDDDIEDLADYFESRAFIPAKQDFDETRVVAGAAVHEKGNCDACHSEGGRVTNGLACILAGQWRPYLAESFRQIRAGERLGPQVMNDAIKSFSEDEIEALLNFYASQQD